MTDLNIPFTEAKLRQALLRAQEIREASWGNDDGQGERYSKDMNQAAEEACAEVGIPLTVAPLIGLANYNAWNDVQGWAQGVYDGPAPTPESAG